MYYLLPFKCTLCISWYDFHCSCRVISMPGMIQLIKKLQQPQIDRYADSHRISETIVSFIIMFLYSWEALKLVLIVYDMIKCQIVAYCIYRHLSWLNKYCIRKLLINLFCKGNCMCLNLLTIWHNCNIWWI